MWFALAILIVLSLVILFSFFRVLWASIKHGHVLLAVAGFIVPAVAFVTGWIQRKKWELGNTMMVWTVCLVLYVPASIACIYTLPRRDADHVPQGVEGLEDLNLGGPNVTQDPEATDGDPDISGPPGIDIETPPGLDVQPGTPNGGAPSVPDFDLPPGLEVEPGTVVDPPETSSSDSGEESSSKSSSQTTTKKVPVAEHIELPPGVEVDLGHEVARYELP